MEDKKILMAQKKKLLEDLSRKKSFDLALDDFLEFRKILFNMYKDIFNSCSLSHFKEMPLSTEKTIAYYMYHLMRIEDISLHTLILNEDQVFHQKAYQEKLQIPITTTGNELDGEEILKFSSQIHIPELKNYVYEVFHKTTEIVSQMTYEHVRMKVSAERKENLLALKSVSKDENAFWLVDYWCKKDYLGLIKMPFIGHQFLHLFACMRIMKKLNI